MPYWKDKVALITGASSGLGLCIATELARGGAKLALAARGEEKLTAAAENLRKTFGVEIVTVPTDVTDPAQLEALLSKTIAQYGHLDVLVNCAGRSTRGDLLGAKPEAFSELMEMNFMSAVRLTQPALPYLLESHGHVINIGSLASKTASPFMEAYAPSKFALAAYSHQLRLDLAPRGLHVLLVCPGPLTRGDAGSRYSDQASGLSDSAQQPGGGAKIGSIEPEWLARKILTACEKRRSELVVPFKSRVLFAIAQLSPRLGDWILRKIT